MNNAIPLTASLLASCLLASCATLADPTDPTPLAAGVETQLPSELPSTLPFTVDPVRSDAFQSLFEDARLSDYLDRALAANTDLIGGRARLRAAEAQTAQARAARSLTLSASGSAGAATLISDFDFSDSGGAGLSFGYDPDVFGRISANVRSAEARQAVQSAELARLQRVVLARTAQSYIDVIASDLQLALARENFEFLGETLRVSRARFEGGAIARADFALSEAEYENARASLAAQEGSVRDARRALASLIGDFADEDLRVANDLPNVSDSGLGLAETASRAVMSRYDVQASRLALVASVADVDAAKAAALPSVSLSGGASGGLALSDLFDIDSYIARLTASLAETLFDGGAEVARIDGAQANVDAQLASYEARAREAYRELVAGFDRAHVFEQRLAALDVAARAAETALDLESIRYDLGEAILLDVLTVQRRVNAIRADRIRTEAGYLQAVADAHLAAGPAR